MKLGEQRKREGIWKRRYLDASRRLTEEYEDKLREYENELKEHANKLKEYAKKLQIIHDLASSDAVPQSKRRTVWSLQDDKALGRTPQECEQRYKVTARAVANAYEK